jgi:chorismate dehydratase
MMVYNQKLIFVTKLNELMVLNMAKIKVGAVSYLNTKPLIYGLQKGAMKKQVELIQEYPSKIAAMLLNNEIDIGLVPVAVIPEMESSYIISDYCIGCKGAVASVCLFSDVPIHEIKEIMLDYQSRTSVELIRILLKEYWKVEPELKNAKEYFRDNIKEGIAGLVIGDRAFQQQKVSAYMYDLGEAWHAHTGLPFVFAAWVSNKRLDDSFIKEFNAATAIGLANIPEIVAETPYHLFDLQQYFTNYISYDLSTEKRKGMELFLKKITDNG